MTKINSKMMLFSYFALLFFFLSSSTQCTTTSRYQTTEDNKLKLYIVQVSLPKNSNLRSSEDRHKWYRSFLPDNSEDFARSRIVYEYDTVMTGFAARLTAKEVEDLQKKDGLVSVQPDRIIKLGPPIR